MGTNNIHTHTHPDIKTRKVNIQKLNQYNFRVISTKCSKEQSRGHKGYEFLL